jgi:DNA-binding HxlR family transcriptional regulator
MKRFAKTPSPCAISGMLELLTRPWTLHILWSLSTNGPMRFGSLRKNLAGISARVLTERLRTLEHAGFVFRHYEQTIPPAVTYGITDRMKDIEKVLTQLEALERKWNGEGTSHASSTHTRPTCRSPKCRSTGPHTPPIGVRAGFSGAQPGLPPGSSKGNSHIQGGVSGFTPAAIT